MNDKNRSSDHSVATLFSQKEWGREGKNELCVAIFEILSLSVVLLRLQV
jgi:hypothetical protein